jgi:hypothetical protein
LLRSPLYRDDIYLNRGRDEKAKIRTNKSPSSSNVVSVWTRAGISLGVRNISGSPGDDSVVVSMSSKVRAQSSLREDKSSSRDMVVHGKVG